MHIDTEQAIKELVANGIRLPPQPKVMIELQQKLASNNCSMSDLGQIISGDPGITAMLFKVARSPAFGGGKQLDSVEQVLMVIGIKQTCNLVQAISLSASISDATRKSFEIFWTRSQEIAQIAALIAEDRVSVCNIFPDQAYMAGIFHECGVPVLMQRFPDYCNKLHLDTAACWPSLAEEDALYNVDHCSIGYLVARHWKLPDFICHAIMYHHEMPQEERGTVRTLIAILQLAIHFYHLITRTEHQLWWKIRDDVLSELGISQDGEQAYYEEISEQFLS
ncbi:MAG: HDOD domain-containing protein [Gallionellaceae bacterium]|jgi:HD-like signal output (HDOD) protein|nr:HDOD domain-containing protein [Gallionellaceae bacterium]